MSNLACRAAGLAAALVLVGCTPPRLFDLHLQRGEWVEAARVFAADTTLLNDERALYDAGMLYGSPTRATYDPERAHGLLIRLLSHFPATQYRTAAADRLALVDAVLGARDSAVAQQRAVELRIDELTAEVARLHAGLDSAQAQTDVLRKNTTRLEADLKDRDEQLRALRLELRQLKEVDLKPRVPPRRPPAA